MNELEQQITSILDVYAAAVLAKDVDGFVGSPKHEHTSAPIDFETSKVILL